MTCPTPAAEQAAPTPGTRWVVQAAGGAPVHPDHAQRAPAITTLPTGTTVLCASEPTGPGSVRIQSPTGWVAAAALAPAAPVPRLRPPRREFDERHLTVVAGDHHGLDVPFTLELLLEAGAGFLTEAFRAAGTIGPGNHVTEIVSLERIGLKGASDNAYLTVRYRHDEGAPEALFVKVPPIDPAQKHSLSPMARSEIELYRLAQERPLPFPVPRACFGDYCSATTNFLLVTERIAFGTGGIEPAYRKGHDHEVPDVGAHYRVLARALGRLVGAHRAGRLGPDIEARFPFPRSARSFAPVAGASAKLERLVRFVGSTAPHLFPAETTASAFLDRWADDILFGLEHRDPVLEFLIDDLDHTGFCHTNLNLDNAWFWRDGAGELQAGLLDWGGVGQLGLGQAIGGMLMMPEPDRYLGLVDLVIAELVQTLGASGGPQLDAEVLRRHHQASLWSTSLCMIVDHLVDALERVPADQYASFRDRHDPALHASGVRSIVVWVDNMLRAWTTPVTPGEVCRDIVARHHAGARDEVRGARPG